MNRVLLTYIVVFLFSFTARSEDIAVLPDTVPYKVSLGEVEILSNPKSEIPLLYFPGSVSVIGERRIERENILSIKEISSLAPNLFIPDYGSKLISAIYIRGIGSRINSPAVGLYVDNIPYLDKSSFDFDFQDIEKIEIFRGPQGTLFGRNTMGGLINIYTVSPFSKQGTKAKIGIGNYNWRNASLTNRGKINDKIAYAVGANYSSHKGYFTNEYNGTDCGGEETAGGNFKLQFRPRKDLDISVSSVYEYSKQNGYPYRKYDKNTGEEYPIYFNDESSYKRNLSTSGVTVKYIHDNFILNSVTGYQFFKDDMKLDQDFTEIRDFTLRQQQKQHAVTQELTVRSAKTVKHWDWLGGLFGFYSHLNTAGPVTFYDEGLKYMVEDPFNKMYASIASRPGFNGPRELVLNLDKAEPLYLDGLYKTPSWGVAAFAQTTYNDLFTKGLGITVGMRLEYEKTKIDHYTSATRDLTGSLSGYMQMGPMVIPINLPVDVPLSVDGKDKMHSLELLPRFEVKYQIDQSHFAYATVSRGYRAGGYNYQAFSNVIRQMMVTGVIPDRFKPLLPAAMTASPDINSMISYQPEHSWNYEIGGHCEWLDKRFSSDVSVFFIDCTDQQISVVEGFGRVTKNSGRTHSAGVEVAVRGEPVKNLWLAAAYGYTHAAFRDNYDGNVSYAGNYVPFSPKHTLSLDATYTIELTNSWLDAIMINAGMVGRGRIYWTEANDVWQNFYGLLNANLGFRKKYVELSIWGKNLTNLNYQSFYFETMNATDVMSLTGFMEQGRPITFGVDISVSF